MSENYPTIAHYSRLRAEGKTHEEAIRLLAKQLADAIDAEGLRIYYELAKPPSPEDSHE